MSTKKKAPPVGYTLSDLGAMFPHSHIEEVGGELVIYTGMAVDEDQPSGTWLRWIEGMFDE